MKQTVNLYLPELRRKKDWLDALRMVQIAGAFLLGFAVLAAWEYFQADRAARGLQDAEARRVAAVAATNALRGSFGVQSPDRSLTEANSQLEDSLKEKRAILEFMSGTDLGNTSGFSAYLADLARYHVQGLSLRSISLARNGRSVMLDGEVARAELVPLYLQNLNKGTTLRGLSFNTLEISEQPLAVAAADGAQAGTAFRFSVSTAQ